MPFESVEYRGRTTQFSEVKPAEAPEVLARHVADAVRRALQEQPHHHRLEKINDLLAQLADDADAVVALEQLLAARLVLKVLDRQVTDISRLRALGFCVSVAHAEYMARVFTEAGIPSRALSGQTPLAERAQAVAAPTTATSRPLHYSRCTEIVIAERICEWNRDWYV